MDKKFLNALIIAGLVVVAITVIDVWGSYLWAEVGGWEGQAYTLGGSTYQKILWSTVFVLTVFLGFGYYALRPDKSEALAVFLIPNILFQFGVEDVLFYWMKGISLFGQTMPWLVNNLWPPTLISKFFGQTVITGELLLLSAVVGVFAAYKTAVYLEAQKW
jgi:hypothetical protein